MKVLFISSGNSGTINPIVKNQAESLLQEGTEISNYLISGGGVLSYIKHIPKLKAHIKKNNFDILHAHYSFSGFTATLASKKPIVVSLMGSDIYSSRIFRKIIFIFYRFFWNSTIVKSSEMQEVLGFKKLKIIPNGVDLEKFFKKEKDLVRKTLNLPTNKKIIIFVANPKRLEKNFKLALEAVQNINREDIILLPVYNIPNESVCDYMNAADALILTSRYEGSVNVIKEAMACNLPIVSTDVGDVKHNLEGVDNCYISKPDPKKLADYLQLVLKSNGTTNGREKLIRLGLDSKTIAGKIISVYIEQINKISERRNNN